MSTILENSSSTPVGSGSDALTEVVDGRLVEKPGMSYFAALVAFRIHAALAGYLKTHTLGVAVFETMFILSRDPNLQRRPDVAFLSFERWPADREVPEEGECHAVPELAVEIISPNDRDRDIQEKLEQYFAHGVRRVWHLRPSTRKVYDYASPTAVTILGEGDTLDASTVLPGLRIEVGPLFRRTFG